MSDDKNDDLFYDDREWDRIKSWKEDGWSCTLIQALSAWNPGDVIENTHSTVNLIKHAKAEITRLRAENETLRRDVKTAIMGDSAELQDVKRENEKLRKALAPFAATARHFKDDCKDTLVVKIGVDVGYLRAAAAAIRESGE